MTKLGNKLQEYRKENNISKSELARLLHISPSYITTLENGKRKNPSASLLLNVSNTLNIPMVDITESDDIENTIEDLQNISDQKIKTNVTNLYEAILTSIESVNYLDCGNKHDLGELLNNTNLYNDIVSLTKDIIKNRLAYSSDLKEKK